MPALPVLARGFMPVAASSPLMPPPKKDTIPVACPKCGHTQPEPRGAYSTVCKKCRQHFRINEEPSAPARPQQPLIAQRAIQCFQCWAQLQVAVAAESTMCKKCSSHVDLRDYVVSQTVSKNFRTFGRLVVEEKGYLLNTDSHVGEGVIKGRFIGKIIAERSLEIHSTANIKGTFQTGRLIVPVGNRFRWPEALRVGAAEIAGEVVANLQSAGTVLLRSTARLFGDVYAGHLVVESGAVFVGAAKIGRVRTSI